MNNLKEVAAKTDLKEAQFHAYVLSCLIGIKWSSSGVDTSAIFNDRLFNVVKEYIGKFYSFNEPIVADILRLMKDKSRTNIKKETKSVLPSIFKKRGFQLPEEIPAGTIQVDKELVARLRNKVTVIKKESDMTSEEIDITLDSIDNGETPEIISTDVTKSSNGGANLSLPEGVNASELTIDNFKEKTGRRFRMTKDQKSRGLDREAAFAEFKQQLIEVHGESGGFNDE